jgi:hypothetical protein
VEGLTVPTILRKSVIVQRLQSLQRINRGHETGPRVPFARLADFLGVTRPTIYAAMRGRMTQTTQIRLSKLLERIELGELAFRRNAQVWELAAAPKGPRPIRMQISFPARSFPKLSFIPRPIPSLPLPGTLADVFVDK